MPAWYPFHPQEQIVVLEGRSSCPGLCQDLYHHGRPFLCLSCLLCGDLCPCVLYRSSWGWDSATMDSFQSFLCLSLLRIFLSLFLFGICLCLYQRGYLCRNHRGHCHFRASEVPVELHHSPTRDSSQNHLGKSPKLSHLHSPPQLQHHPNSPKNQPAIFAVLLLKRRDSSRR